MSGSSPDRAPRHRPRLPGLPLPGRLGRRRPSRRACARGRPAHRSPTCSPPPCTAPRGPSTAAWDSPPIAGSSSSPSTWGRPAWPSSGRSCCASSCGCPRSSASPRSPTSSRAATASRRRSARWWRLLVVCGMIPYIALQLKAVSASFKMILREESVLDVFDPTLLVAVTLALFGILFGARNLDFTKQQTGLMTAVAVESVVKLVAFLARRRLRDVGPLRRVRRSLRPGAAAHPEWSRLLTLDQPHHRVLRALDRHARDLDDGGDVPAAAVPRAGRPESRASATSNAVSWSFPLYLLLINLFVLPIALRRPPRLPGGGRAGGRLHPPAARCTSTASSSRCVVFLGGFSAATAMIVVDSLALSKMITNDIILPILLRRRRMEDIYWITLFYTRLAMLAVVAPRLRVGADGARPAPPRGDGAPLVHRGEPSARPPSCSVSTGGAATAGAPTPGSRPASSCGSTP